MTFSSPRPNLYESSEGFSVEVLGMFRVLYREGARRVYFDCEPLLPERTMALYLPETAAWEPPHDGAAIDDQELARIVNNVHRAFTSHGLELEIG